jgi:hypothetical protein
MRYTYRQLADPLYVRPVRAVTETVETHSDAGVEVLVTADTYDRVLAVLAEHGNVQLPSDVAAVFQHRGPFSVVCDPAGG